MVIFHSYVKLSEGISYWSYWGFLSTATLPTVVGGGYSHHEPPDLYGGTRFFIFKAKWIWRFPNHGGTLNHLFR